VPRRWALRFYQMLKELLARVFVPVIDPPNA
jgi:hypothetical protein